MLSFTAEKVSWPIAVCAPNRNVRIAVLEKVCSKYGFSHLKTDLISKQDNVRCGTISSACQLLAQRSVALINSLGVFSSSYLNDIRGELHEPEFEFSGVNLSKREIRVQNTGA